MSQASLSVLPVEPTASPASTAHAPLHPVAPANPTMFHGVLGEFVHLIASHTEADPHAILFQALAGFGCLIGPKPHVLVEATRHRANLNVCIVGQSAKARKGTGWDHVAARLRSVDPEFSSSRIISGLASGEGLIWAARNDANGDAGEDCAEKRLLVVEPEFANVLRVMRRDGNILSGTIRNAWDHGNLQNATKRDAARVNGAHITLITHITQPELATSMSTVDILNGFGNRFIWACSFRSRLLPDGGAASSLDYSAIDNRIHEAITSAKSVGRLERDAEATALWRDWYMDGAHERPGFVGELLGREEAQAVRLSLIYALADSSTVIRKVHLEAAIAAMDYSARCVEEVFASRTGSFLADRILADLSKAGERGISRSDIHMNLGGHVRKEAIDDALGLLEGLGKARYEKEAGSGRHVTRWYAVAAQEA